MGSGEEESEDDEAAENEVWFEEAVEAFQANPSDETVLANFQEAKRAFYKDARKALDQSKVNRGFYPNGKGKTKGAGKTKAGKKSDEFQGQCMRCGKWGHRAQHCPQGCWLRFLQLVSSSCRAGTGQRRAGLRDLDWRDVQGDHGLWCLRVHSGCLGPSGLARRAGGSASDPRTRSTWTSRSARTLCSATTRVARPWARCK